MGPARAAASPKKRLKAAAKVAPIVPSKPVGIAGGGNYAGRIQTIEPNVLLREQSAFGRAGTQSIGEWADLALTNPFVTAGLDFICAPIADARIDIEVDEESESSKLQVDFLRWALEKKFRLAAHNDTAARGFLVSGFALFEPRAELVPCPVLGRDAFALASLEQRLPNSLSPNAWREDADGRLIAIEQQGPKGGLSQWTTLQLPAKDTLLYSWKRLGNNWAGESQLRSVWYLAARIMPLLLKLVGVTSQREGAGLPVAFAKDTNTSDITPDQRAELMGFLANASFHEASGIVMPQGFDVKWIHSPGSDKGFILDIWKALGLVVLQQLGAQQMVLGTDNTGSRSVGEVHDARAMAFVRKVLSFQEGVLNGDGGESHTGLVSRLLAWNGLLGADGSAPRVKLTPKRAELGPKEMAEAISAAKNAGLVTPTLKDQNAFRERASLPPLTEDEFKELSGAGTTTALNGAQVTAATDLMQRVADGQLPIEAATEALITFYNVAPERAAKLMQTLKTFRPEPSEPAPSAREVKPEEGVPKMVASSKEPERDVWNSMWARCSNRESKDWARYGGRGIKVCERWESYENFIADMGRRPSDEHSIDRIDNDGNYEPSNCRWATAKEQRGNRSDSVKASAQRTAWQPWRALRASEQGVKFAEIAEYFDGRREEFERRLRPLVVLMLSKAAPALDAAMADGVISPQEISAVTLATAPLRKAIGKYLAEDRAAGAEFLRLEMAGKLRAAAEEEEDDKDIIRRDADDVIEAQQDLLVQRMENRLRSELAREAIDVLRTGGDATEVWTRAVARQIESGAFKADAGTVTTKAFAVGRQEAAEILGGIASVELSALLDSKTCEACERMDGRTAAFDSAEHDAMLPPLRDCAGGDNCRCLLLYVPTKGDE